MPRRNIPGNCHNPSKYSPQKASADEGKTGEAAVKRDCPYHDSKTHTIRANHAAAKWPPGSPPANTNARNKLKKTRPITARRIAALPAARGHQLPHTTQLSHIKTGTHTVGGRRQDGLQTRPAGRAWVARVRLAPCARRLVLLLPARILVFPLLAEGPRRSIPVRQSPGDGRAISSETRRCATNLWSCGSAPPIAGVMAANWPPRGHHEEPRRLPHLFRGLFKNRSTSSLHAALRLVGSPPFAHHLGRERRPRCRFARGLQGAELRSPPQPPLGASASDYRPETRHLPPCRA